MCPAAACLPCWPCIQFACACCCPYLPDLLGHMDFLMLSGRVFPHSLWQSSLWAAKDYKAPLCCLLVAGEVGRATHLSSHRVAKDIIVLPPISVYIRRRLWCAVPVKQLWCLFSCPYSKSASGKGMGRAHTKLPASPQGTCTGLLYERSEGLVCRMVLEQILQSWINLSCCM